MKSLNTIKTILLVSGFFCYSGSFAQNAVAKINSYFNEIGKLHQLNGNILLAQKGRVITSRSFGYADFKTQKSNTAESRFNLASISKLFTSTAILQLRDLGKLSLDDRIVKFIPDFPFKEVTIRHLLTHTSGLPDFEMYEEIALQKPGKVITNNDILPALKKWKRGLYFNPGDRFQYCNVGYSLLSMVVEKISGLSFSVYLKRNIFRPAGMKDTYLSVYPGTSFYEDKDCVKMHFKPHPFYDTTYAYADSSALFGYIKFQNYICSGPVGGSNIISTTTDLFKFDQAFFDGRLLKKATLEEALTPMKLNNGEVFYDKYMDTMLGEGKMAVGLGWDIFLQPGYGRSVGHGGFLHGNATFYFHNIERGQTIIAFDNTAGSEYGRIITSSLYLLNGQEPMEIRNHQSLAFIYGNNLVKKGADAAASAFNAIKSDTAHYYLNEWEFNQLGGNLMFRSFFEGHQNLALEVFKINTLLFPNSFNTYDSYAEGLREILC